MNAKNDPRLVKVLGMLAQQVQMRGQQMIQVGELLALMVQAIEEDRPLPRDEMVRIITTLQGMNNPVIKDD